MRLASFHALRCWRRKIGNWTWQIRKECWKLDHCLKLLALALIAEELVMAIGLSVPGRFGLLQLDLPPWSQLLISIDPNVVSKQISNLNSICYWAYAVLINSLGPLGLSSAIILHHNWFTVFPVFSAMLAKRFGCKRSNRVRILLPIRISAGVQDVAL